MASIVMASKVSADKLGLILGPEKISWACIALDFIVQAGVRSAATSVIFKMM
jgi:hypothetical protein